MQSHLPPERVVIYSALPRLFYNPQAQPPTLHGTWQQNGSGTLEDFTIDALLSLRDLGITHLWLIGVIRHATTTDFHLPHIPTQHPDIVKGHAGSPYAITDYYDMHPAIVRNKEQRMAAFHDLIDRCKQVGLKLIIDFVPNHVSRQYASTHLPEGEDDLGATDNSSLAFHPNNNFYYLPHQTLELAHAQHKTSHYAETPAKATGNDQFHAHPSSSDWYETIKLNYGVDYSKPPNHPQRNCFSPIPNTWHKMLNILLYWVEQGVDGFRCDMAEMVPTEFWQWAIPQVKAHHATLFIAEFYNLSQYQEALQQSGFDIIYDKSGLYDTLRTVVQQNASALALPPLLQHNAHWGDRLLYFLENHDEQRFACDFFAGSPALGKPAMGLIALGSTQPLMIYFGQELGEAGMDREGFSGLDGRTSIFDYWSIDKMNRRANHGDYTTALLSTDERALLAFYQTLLSQWIHLPCIAQGNYIDLMPSAQAWGGFDPHRVVGFVRMVDHRQAAVVVCNFSSETVCFPAMLSPELLSLPSSEQSVVTLQILSPLSSPHPTPRLWALQPYAPLLIEVPPQDLSLILVEPQ